MKTIFFEWGDFDEVVKDKHDLQLPEGSTTDAGGFELSKAKGYEAVSIKVFSRISNSHLDELKESGTKVIALRVAGFNMLDVDYATEIGLKVYRVAAYSPESIAEYAMALVLMLARRLNVQREQHRASNEVTNINSMGFVLRDKTLGLHGYGKIARELAKIAREGFGMNVIFFDPFFDHDSPDEKVDSLEELYSRSRVVSIHVPLNEDTKGSVNKQVLSNANSELVLVNTSRGPVVNSEDVKELLKEGKLQYFATDVWGEDDQYDPELLTDHTFQSHHIAFFTEEAVYQMISQTLESLSGNPRQENILPISYD